MNHQASSADSQAPQSVKVFRPHAAISASIQPRSATTSVASSM